MKYKLLFLFFITFSTLTAQNQDTNSNSGEKSQTIDLNRKVEDKKGHFITNLKEKEFYLKNLQAKIDADKKGRTKRVSTLVPVNLCSNSGFEEFENTAGTNFLKSYSYDSGSISNPSQCKDFDPSMDFQIAQYNPVSSPYMMAATIPSTFIDPYIGNINAFDQFALKVNYEQSSETAGVVQTKRFKTNNENVLQFNFKAVLESILNDTSHQDNQPFFKARIVNKNGVTVSEFCLIGDKDNCIFTQDDSTVGSNEIILYTKNWQTGTLDLSSIPNNEEFTVEFTAARCGWGAHFGYAYVDDICYAHSTENIQGSIQLDPLYKDCPTLPTSVCGSYTVPNSGGTVATAGTITLSVYNSSNTVVYTSTTPSSLDPINHLFCFELTAANLPNTTNENYNVGVSISYNVLQAGCAGTVFNLASDNDANPGWDISFLNCTNCNITVQPAKITKCDINKDGKEFFNLNDANTDIIGTQTGLQFSYFLDLTNAMNNTNPILNFLSYESSSGYVYVRVQETATCYKIIPLQLIVKNPYATISGILNVCSGSTTLTASPGASYLWSNGQTSQNVVVSSNGTYSVTVTDAFGCQGDATVTILPNQVAVQPSFTVLQPTCFTNTGTITVTSPASEYSFDGGFTWTTNPVSPNLSIGNHQVQIKTITGCISYSVNVTISQFFLPTPDYTSVQPTFCGDVGSITITTVAAEYSFDNGATWSTNNTATNLASGTYKVRFKDLAGCISNSATVVLNGEFLTAPDFTVVQPICGTGGTITITTVASEYSFDDGVTWSTNNTITNQAVGGYVVRIKNNLGCTSAPNFAYLNNFYLPIPLFTVSQPTCTVGGIITVTTVADQYSFDGGYSWTTNPVASNLNPGYYVIEVKNALGCESQGGYVYLNLNYLPNPIYNVTQFSCGVGGSIVITSTADFYSVDGGATWQTTPSFTNLPSGSYNVMVKDSAGCISQSSYVYIYDSQIASPNYTAVQPTCDAAGSITITTLGTAYSFDNGITWSTSPTATNLQPGNYQIRIKNENGCISQANYITLSQQYLPKPEFTVVSPFCTETTGIITIVPTNGYTYSFDNGMTYQTSNISTPLTPGTYYIKVKNSNGCESQINYATVSPPTGIPNAPTGNSSQLFCTFNSPTVHFLIAVGQNIQWYTTPSGGSPLASNTPLIDGMTYYASQTIGGCESQIRLAVSVTLSSFVIVGNDYTTLVCDYLNDGSEIVDLSTYNSNLIVSASNYSFTYFNSLLGAENNTASDQINNSSTYHLSLGNNIIYVRIQSANGCYLVVQLKFTLIPSPLLSMADEYILCENTTINIDAGAGFDSYLWSTGAITPSITVNQAGNYSVTVTQNHGIISCPTTKNIVVKPSNRATVSNIVINDWTSTDNTITILLSDSSIGNYEYSIDGIHYQDSNTFTGLENGEYQVFIRDKNKCGITTDDVYLLVHPQFFTPNGDGIHDTWRIKFSEKEAGLKIRIFDRQGKFLKELDNNSPGWNGTFNGVPLPATDYWFVVTRANGKEYRGHFAMKR